MRCRHIALLALALLLAARSRAAAIPPFARAYGLSCSTCHVAGPKKLGAFGEAFRDNGYRIPGNAGDFVREPPLAIGNPRLSAQPGGWRTHVPPGEIPGTAPIGVLAKIGAIATIPRGDTAPAATLAWDAEAELLVGGSLGPHFSFFGVLAGGTEGVHLEQLFGIGRSLFERWLGEATLNLKVGHMHLDLFAVMPELQRSVLLPLPLALTVGREGFALGNAAEALEAYGLIGGRLKWVVGVANGPKPLDDLKTRRDFLGRLQLKLGGSRLDYKDVRDLDSAPTFSMGAFTYIGVGVNVPALPEPRFASEIYRLGFDARFRAAGLDVLGQVVLGQDSDPDGLGDQVRHVSWSLGMDYPILPWLQPLVRFEEAYFDNYRHVTQRRLVMGIQVFIRANARMAVEGATGLSTNQANLLVGNLLLAM